MAESPAAGAGAGAAGEPHRLHTQWDFYEWSERDRSIDRNWKDQLRLLFTFSTVEEFWHAWTHIPHITEVFKTSRESVPPKVERTVTVGDKTGTRTSAVKGYALFRHGIKPLEEHKVDGRPVNLGRRLTEGMPSNKAEYGTWDKAWETVVLAAIGEQVDMEGILNGVYVLDKTEGKPRTTPPRVRIELWTNTDDDVTCAKLTSATSKLLSREISGPPFDFRKSGRKRRG